MKNYIREILDDLKSTKNPDHLPEVPKSPTDGKTVYLEHPPLEPVPADLDNQKLSDDAAQRVRQLDYQAQKENEREALS
jgi:hypothetical protein